MKSHNGYVVICCLVFVFLVVCLPLAAQENMYGQPGRQRMFSVGHPVYQLLEDAYRDAGRVLPELAWPASAAQLGFMIDQLNDARLSAAGRARLEAAARYLKAWDGPAPVLSEAQAGMAVQFVPIINLQVRFDDENPQQQVLAPPLDLLRLDVRAQMAPVFAEMQAALRQEPNYDYLSPGSRSNIPMNIDHADSNFPKRAYMASGTERWSIQLGRDKLSWGTSQTGSLTLSGKAPYHDFIRIAGFFRSFSYSGIFMRQEPFARQNEIPSEGPYVPPVILRDDDGDPLSPEDHYRHWQKALVIHRFTMRPIDSLRFSLMESVGIAGYTPDLRFFNPFMVNHNYYDFTTMTFATSAEITLTPMAGLEISGQWYMNDFMLPQEEAAGATEPNAMAWLGGVHWQRPLGQQADSALLKLGGEIYYGDPYVYIRESVLRSFISRQRVHTNWNGSGMSLGMIEWNDEFLGSPFGNDSFAWQLRAEISWLQLARVQTDFVRHSDGQNGPADILPADGSAVLQETPSGVAENINQWTIAADVSSQGIAPLHNVLSHGLPGGWFAGTVLDLGAVVRLVWLENADHVQGRTDFRPGVAAKMGVSWQW
ncbi:MAG: hypothetical protein D6B26_05400 [Spirochaetaceae bacterium]|nr:MAG: hypothetical protein D6B26_05400 [Spirochaetaceae bacterium]